jgi:hypothetical protein
MLDRTSSLWNNGYAGGIDDVNLYSEKGYRGDWNCVAVGETSSSLPQWFTYGPKPSDLASHSTTTSPPTDG